MMMRGSNIALQSSSTLGYENPGSTKLESSQLVGFGPVRLRIEYPSINALLGEYLESVRLGRAELDLVGSVDVGTQFIFELYAPALDEPVELHGRVSACRTTSTVEHIEHHRESNSSSGTVETTEQFEDRSVISTKVLLVFPSVESSVMLHQTLTTLMERHLGTALVERLLK